MQEANVQNNDSYREFIELFKLETLESALKDYKGSKEYDDVLRYYFACIGKLELPRLLEPLALLKQTLESMSTSARAGKGSDPAAGLGQIRQKIADFERRLQYSVEQMKTPATEVPKIMHFVWLGGGVGDIQRDYLNVWKRVMAGRGYTLNLWYDSDALLAHQTNRLLVEAAKADVHRQLDGRDITDDELATLYEERAIVLKQQMYAHINAAVAAGQSADDARIDLLARAYGQDTQELQALMTRNLLSVTGVGDDDLVLRDLGDLDTPMALQDLYERETRLRGNLAAASDIVRIHALSVDGGSYADVDNLPPLADRLGTTDITGWGADARLGALQVLLDHNPDWMPGRQAIRARYTSYFERIPQEHRAALQAFGQGRPSLAQVFRPPLDRLARPYELRAVAESSSLSNACLMAHPGAGMLQAVIARMRFNYEVIEGATSLARKRNVALSDNDNMQPLALEVVEQALGPLHALAMEEEIFAGFLASAVAGYFRDGIRPQSEGTIYLTGPAAMRDGIRDYQKQHFTPQAAESLYKDLAIEPLATVNRATEEEQDHSWKDNATDPQKWVADEQARWRDGRYATRYSGDIAQLLKGSTVEFQNGWPVIEGRVVLRTDMLHRLLDSLGEPFGQAMRSGLEGVVRFEKELPLSFTDRQTIRAQPSTVLPPAFLSDIEMASFGLDDVLTRIAKGTLHIVQTTPLQRLALGVLLGAESLDNQHLIQLQSELDNLANSFSELGAAQRYAVIERHLYKHQSADFLHGLASIADDSPVSSGSAPEPSALELKRNAMRQASTPFQWGRRVTQIQQLATLEHRVQVVERVGQVLQHFDAASVKLVPQDLLLQGTGDAIAGRCYPLSLVMSAALAQGARASRRLRERFYLAVVEPQQSDSVAFLDALEQLRDVPLSDVGQSQGRADLSDICARLQASDDSLGLLLNSDNHVLLLAKTVSAAGDTTLHFFDPNFGLFEFDDPAVLQSTLEDFFIGRGMADYYAAFGDPARPTFDLIALQSERISGLPLSAGFKLGQLLTSDSLPGHASVQPIRQRMASARGRALSENAHLGRSLLALDSRWWARQIADVTIALQPSPTSARPWVPLFDTLQITPQGTYQMQWIDPEDATRVTRVVSSDHRLLRIRQWLTEQFSALVRKPQGESTPAEPVEVGAVHTLNAGFALQSLMLALRDHESDDRTLTLAVRLHGYINYAQLAHGLVVDAAGLMKLYTAAINEEKVIARTYAPVVGEVLGHVANEGVGTLLGLANVGFDIYQVAHARNEVETARFGTQLGFDSASLAAGLGALVAAASGAVTVAGVLGGAGVLLAGLAIGAAALAQGFALIAEEAKQVGLFFDHLEKAWGGSAYRFDDRLQAWVVEPSSMIIECVDLSAGQLILGSPMLYRLRDHFGVPDIDADEKRALNIRAQWAVSGQIRIAMPAGQRIVLPCTPRTYYSYEYKALPFASWRHDAGFDAARRLERKDGQGKWRFLFSFYSFPSHYIVHRLYPNYRPTTIEVRLDAAERQLVVPIIPTAWHGLITYELKATEHACTLVLNRGVSIRLNAPDFKTTRWVLVADWANVQDVKTVDGTLWIDGIDVNFNIRGKHEVLVSLSDQRIYRIVRHTGELQLLQDTAPAGLDEQALLSHYQKLARDHRLVLRHTPVNRYLIPYESPQAPRYTKAWYDAHEDRFLYMRSEEQSDSHDVLLAAVVGDRAYFYEPDSLFIWQVDAVTGLLRNRYRLMLKSGKGSILRVEADNHGVVHVVQQYEDEDPGIQQFGYLIHDRQLQLCSMTFNAITDGQTQALAGDTLTDWKAVLGDYWPLADKRAKEGDTTVDWNPAPYVSVSWQPDETRRDLHWIRRRDNLIIRPLPMPGKSRGWDDAIRHLDQLMLLVVNDEQDIFVIYDRNAQSLCRLQRGRDGRAHSWSSAWIQPPRLQQVAATQGGYVAMTVDGQLFNLDIEGRLQFAGLSEAWLQNRPRWWEGLETLAKRYPVDHFTLIGLRDRQGEAPLNAWYIDQRLLLCEPINKGDVRLLGLTPDKRLAWLFEPAGGEICSQAFIDSDQLGEAFAGGLQLLRSDLLPTPQTEWEEWRFSRVMREGVGLKGVTVEGVELTLPFEDSERLTGVNHAWVTAQGDHLLDSLRELSSRVAHDGFVSTESQPGVWQWYDVDNARLIQVADKTLHGDIELLGTWQRSQVLLHDRQDGRVLAYPQAKRFGPFEHVQRDAGVMVLEGQHRVKDLASLVPDGVGTLILQLGQGAVTYDLPKALWLECDAVIVDCRPVPGERVMVPGKLVWSLDEPQKLQVQIVGEHLVFIEPDSEHCLILREVCSDDPMLRGDPYLALGHLSSLPASHLIHWLRNKPAAMNCATLDSLLAQGQVTG